MRTERAHLIGNGPSAELFLNHRDVGDEIKIACNLPPFDIPDLYGLMIIDMKVMALALNQHPLLMAHPWILSTPLFNSIQDSQAFGGRYDAMIRHVTAKTEIGNPQHYSAGHAGAVFAAGHLRPDELHLYGMDSLFDDTLNSQTDTHLASVRTQEQSNRLLARWRPLWVQIFKSFPECQFVLHHQHERAALALPDNVGVLVD